MKLHLIIVIRVKLDTESIATVFFTACSGKIVSFWPPVVRSSTNRLSLMENPPLLAFVKRVRHLNLKSLTVLRENVCYYCGEIIVAT